MSRREGVADRGGNRLLDSLPGAYRDRYVASMSRLDLESKTVLFEPGEEIDAVHFPLGGVISLVTPLKNGAIVEVATVGNEGMVGVPLVAGGSLAVRAISAVRGPVLRMEVADFHAEMGRAEPFRDVVFRYLLALIGQISQAAACNRLHSNEERLARWLLMSHDRVGLDEFCTTHELLGQMLGSRRATVSLSAGVLQAAGLIHYRRGRVTILDRSGLEKVSCECYAVIKAELDRVVPLMPLPVHRALARAERRDDASTRPGQVAEVVADR